MVVDADVAVAPEVRENAELAPVTGRPVSLTPADPVGAVGSTFRAAEGGAAPGRAAGVPKPGRLVIFCLKTKKIIKLQRQSQGEDDPTL
jgi:hypothetical protein